MRKDGSQFYAQLNAMAIQDSEGQLSQCRIVITDITEGKKAEAALRESEQRYGAFLNSTTDLAFLKNEAFRYVMVNKANQEFFGKTETEIIGKTDFELMPPIAAEKCRASDLEALGRYGIVVTEEELGGRVFETKKFAAKLENGQTGIGGLIREVTDRRRAEEALRESEEKYRLFIETANEAVFVAQNGVLRFANRRCIELTGYSEAELLSKPMIDFIHPDDREMVVQYHQRRLRGDDTRRIHTLSESLTSTAS